MVRFRVKVAVKREDISLVQYKNNISEWKVTIKVQNVCVLFCVCLLLHCKLPDVINNACMHPFMDCIWICTT